MAWLRIDDRVRTHPKIANAGPAAAWLWFCGICYCREHLTDGLIPKAVVPSLAMNLPSPWKHAAKLVDVRLWEDTLGGYQVHDFLDWNPSRDEVMSLRDKERDKKRTQRGTPRGHGGDSRVRARDRAGDAGLGSPSPRVGSGSELSEESVRETVSDFEKFWAVYPRKTAKATAKAEYQRVNPAGALTDAILAGLRSALRSRIWREAMREPEMPHIPHARTWLHQRRWEDSPTITPAAEPSHDWSAECQEMHGGTCESRYQHGLRCETLA